MKFTQLLLALSFGLITEGTLMCAAAKSKTQQDHYAILGIPRNAPLAVIKSAWREKQQQYHPDRNGGDEIDEETKKAAYQEILKINAAYDILKNPAKRRAYDLGGDAEVARVDENVAREEQAHPGRDNVGDAHAGNDNSQQNDSYDIDQSGKFSAFWKQILRGTGAYLSKGSLEYFSKQTIESLRNANPKKAVILALVPAVRMDNDEFGLSNMHVYEAHQFNQYIATDHNTENQSGPRNENLREPFPNDATRKLEAAEPCYIILEPGANRFTYLCSLSDLTQSGLAGETLRDRFQQASDGNFNYEKQIPQIACTNVFLNAPLPATLKPHFSAYAKSLLISTIIALGQGVVNNWLGRKYNVDNTSFWRAPFREWGTAILAMIIEARLQDKTFLKRVTFCGHTLEFIALSNMFATGAQMLGEVIPLPKGYAGYRSMAPNLNAVKATGAGLLWAITA